MIIRIVKMTFRKSEIDAFTTLFEARKALIRSFEGCLHLELWQDAHQPHVFCTYSHWESEAHLDKYRFSELFKDTWARTKALFLSPPEATSLIRKTMV